MIRTQNEPEYAQFASDVLDVVKKHGGEMGQARTTQFLFDAMATLGRALDRESDEPLNAFVEQYHGVFW